ncbi:phospholipase D-like protein [Mesonia algae]|uniref:Phospholipase D-like protein n=1 Tax=Mesonia algae TaxID=213248 RepID=A0A2W7K2E3_9FLAO|nr:phospholipase D-like protein [Mesonia algae]
MKLFSFIYILFLLLVFAVMVWAIVDIFKSKNLQLRYKGVLMLGVVFFPLIGSLIYFAFKKEFIKK